MKDSIKSIVNNSRTGDDRFLEIIDQAFNPIRCDQKELNFLVNFLEGNNFNKWIAQKQKVSSELKNLEEDLEIQIQKIYTICHLFDQLNTHLQYYITDLSSNEGEEKVSVFQFQGFSKFKDQLIPKDFILIRDINGNRTYKQNEQILRQENKISGQKNEKILNNFEQMKYLDFKGQYGINGYKIKQWNYFWKEKNVGGGLYNIYGQKVGSWIDLCENYWDENKVYEEGQYEKNKRFGNWIYKWNNIKIGGGQYDENGEGTKIGYWIDLSENFSRSHQVIYNGKYKDGKKVGIWEIKFKQSQWKEFKQIGGGQYDNENGDIKVGKWIELSENFKQDDQIVICGENQNGKKFGRWDILSKQNDWKEFYQIGGGSYDNGNEEKKFGKWIELNENFKQDNQIVICGEYQNGKKFGRWDILSSAGGLYDTENGDIKVGKWVELSENFKKDCQVILCGEYINGLKAGRWDIKYKQDQRKEFKIMQIINKSYLFSGGGSYGNEIGEIKQGAWIELNDSFKNDSQVILCGEYVNGLKAGRWDIKYKQDQWKEFKLIGGGSYDNEIGGIKQGAWIELNDRFKNNSQVILCGEYVNGLKSGQWDIKYKQDQWKEFQLMYNYQYIMPFSGGGQYENEIDEIKKGAWIELNDSFKNNSQIIFCGEYVNGLKAGRWDIKLKQDQWKEFKFIGGGSYDYGIGEIKQGAWIELNDSFKNNSQVILCGEYVNGIKAGRWDIKYKQDQWKEFQIMQIINKSCLFSGGGSYGNEIGGIKQGAWIELNDSFKNDSQVILCGEYVNGLKSGRWDIKYKQDQWKEFQLIGGGPYDNDIGGIKQGAWIELSNSFKNDSQIILDGKYFNGQKVGIWDIKYKQGQWKEFQIIGGGIYDYEIGIKTSFIFFSGEYVNGLKSGKWDTQYKQNLWKKLKLIGGGLYESEVCQVKIGNWIELNERFQWNSQIIYKGNYENGQKVGRWEIKYKQTNEQEFETIGGGSYEDGFDKVKIGNWIELSERFKLNSQIIYNGNYQNGQKVGRWDIKYKQLESKQFEIIGGGSYDLSLDNVKIGNWVELSERFKWNSQIIYNGNYQNGQKAGKWDIMYKYPQSQYFEEIGGGSYEENFDKVKKGNWIELSERFKWNSQIIYNGNYQNGQKVGKWEIKYQQPESKQFELIGGGSYDLNLDKVKIGNWVELSERFKWNSQIIYNGNYQNGQKVGKWEIQYKQTDEKEFETIGGGSYEEGFDQVKIGNWIELSERFKWNSQIIYNGNYQNGQNGGGSYEEGFDQVKIGNWIELSERFKHNSQIIYNGNFQNGLKVGKWEIKYKSPYEIQFSQMLKFNIIFSGGGYYDDQINEIKIGNWIELSDRFKWNFQIIYDGNYQQGQKVGKWEIKYKNPYEIYFQSMLKFNTIFSGGGQYDNQMEQIKIGNWVEINERFICNPQIIYNGQYKDGLNIGQWDIFYKKSDQKKLQDTKNGYWIEIKSKFQKDAWISYSGGYLKGKKHGKWKTSYNNYNENQSVTLYTQNCNHNNGFEQYDVEKLSIEFQFCIELQDIVKNNSKYIIEGEYMGGKKVGLWNIYDWNKKIGGGLYNQAGNNRKIGNWIELSEGFKSDYQVTYQGEYLDGYKVGQWNIYACNKKIGGGLYSEIGNNRKIGRWIELGEGFRSDCQVTYQGEYLNGYKVGQWNIYAWDKKMYIFINIYSKSGGGLYNQAGNNRKIGNWIELSEGFKSDYQVIYQGEYLNGYKVGQWNIYAWNKKIEGGLYNQAGNNRKIGKWIELGEGFKFDYQVTYKGEYLDGYKVGQWNIYAWDKKIGGGLYNQAGNNHKIGEWVELREGFAFDSQIVHKGVYLNGYKVGQWNIYAWDKKIGGGLYCEIGNNLKTAIWIELSQRFTLNSKVTYQGKYKEGKKVGKWNIACEQKEIGGGSYDENDGQVKVGNWIELDEFSQNNFQILFHGEYKRGKKVGRWITSLQQTDQIEDIGGGSYDKDDSIKIGTWIELINEFTFNSQVIYRGDYQNGKKVGKWDIKFKNVYEYSKYETIGGGSYQKPSIKIGKWIELSNEFSIFNQITYYGNYKNDKKVGKWVEKDISENTIKEEINYEI
ncbi:unnamed protein product [Paramecium octaurelia]|uniref:Uncharacterized protein n=1 Tax=Paramecium octaurelia TaxID=43137 RepID=A0A8S1WD54_PAROT|nr:unnamed protein product [Paramecium octaurelia]